ncbi:unnamed protein product [Linum tenue]|uniref:Uncharacterized protein n=1 Tax=Linum tenue TaxID=586396 RepID=A0AAV0IZZ2_9ROSI|nr:unnamed protein product [Linum tenue]
MEIALVCGLSNYLFPFTEFCFKVITWSGLHDIEICCCLPSRAATTGYATVGDAATANQPFMEFSQMNRLQLVKLCSQKLFKLFSYSTISCGRIV